MGETKKRLKSLLLPGGRLREWIILVMAIVFFAGCGTSPQGTPPETVGASPTPVVARPSASSTPTPARSPASVPVSVPVSVPLPQPTSTPAVPIPTATPRPNSTPVALPSPGIDVRPQILVGWLEEYSSFIEEQVSNRHSELLNLSPARMDVICPQWDRLETTRRKKFWSSLLWAIAAPESKYQRNLIYLEPGTMVDGVTRQNIRSEGLLQLSYADVRNYHYPESDISWEKDKEMALRDYAAKAVTGDPGRTIFNAYANLNLGLWVMEKNLRIHVDENLETALGHYWSTMRVNRNGFQKVLGGMKSKAGFCYRD